MVGEAGDEGDGVVVWPSDCARVGSVESGPSVDISGEVGDAPVLESDGVTFGVGSSGDEVGSLDSDPLIHSCAFRSFVRSLWIRHPYPPPWRWAAAWRTVVPAVLTMETSRCVTEPSESVKTRSEKCLGGAPTSESSRLVALGVSIWRSG